MELLVGIYYTPNLKFKDLLKTFFERDQIDTTFESLEINNKVFKVQRLKMLP